MITIALTHIILILPEGRNLLKVLLGRIELILLHLALDVVLFITVLLNLSQVKIIATNTRRLVSHINLGGRFLAAFKQELVFLATQLTVESAYLQRLPLRLQL